MKKNRTKRLSSVFLALWLCIALMPMGAFAEDLPDAAAQGDEQETVLAQDQAAEDTALEEAASAAESEDADTAAAYEEEQDATAAEDVPVTKTSFKLNGNKLVFKEAVVSNSFLNKNTKIDHIWVKGGEKFMRVYWDLPENLDGIDGVIMLRKDGNSKSYIEAKRVVFRKTDPDTQQQYMDPKEYSKDTAAKRKNTPYRYIVVTYKAINGYTYISYCSDWAAGQTSRSKQKTATKATISASSLKMQVNDKKTLSFKYKDSSSVYAPKEIRWYSDDKEVAKVNKTSGKVTAVDEGKTTIRGRLSSGREYTCTVKVVGAFTPGTPTNLRVDVASNTSITLLWGKAKYASYYRLYKSTDGVHWDDPVKVYATTKKVTGLTHNKKYYFYVTAVNENAGYREEGGNSSVVSQKAVIKRRDTTVSGWPTSKSLTSGTTYSVKLKIGSPDGRKASLQYRKNKKWTTKKSISLPSGSGTSTVTVTFPNTWWDGTTEWRLDIPQNNTSTGYTTKTLKIKAARRYQNPSQYVQISNSISKHGYSYYTSKVRINSTSTRSDCIEALIATAESYKGYPYAEGRSGAPSGGVDASGLVIQACYGAGVDLWPVSPATRKSNCVPSIKDSKLKAITYTEGSSSGDHPGVNRGDLIIFTTGKGMIAHIAIYLGFDKVIHADPVKRKVNETTIKALTNAKGDYKYKVIAVRRIFN